MLTSILNADGQAASPTMSTTAVSLEDKWWLNRQMHQRNPFGRLTSSTKRSIGEHPGTIASGLLAVLNKSYEVCKTHAYRCAGYLSRTVHAAS